MGLGNKEVKRWSFTIYYFDSNKAVTHTEHCTTKPITRKRVHELIREKIYDRECCFTVNTKGFWK